MMKRDEIGIDANVQSNNAEAVVSRFKRLYTKMDAENIPKDLIHGVYSQDLHFEDSFHQLRGLESFYDYCQSLYQNLTSIKFYFHEDLQELDQALLTWTLVYKHRLLNRGREIRVDGASHIRYRDKIFFHKDYFDGGQLMYEQIPLLGSLVKTVKKRVK